MKLQQKGEIDPLIIPLVMSVVLVIGLTVFGIWAYMQYVDNRDNVAEKVAEAVADAKVAQQEELEIAFAEREKLPTRTYISPGAIGSVRITYPKTWSVYADEREKGAQPLNAYFHPKYIPANDDTAYAARLTVENSAYDREVDEFKSKIEKGTVKAKPIKVSDIPGVRLDGNIFREFNGTMVIFPLRDKTIKVWTQADTFQKDFDSIILANLSFEP